ncbi:MAG: hypothetical protein QG662_1639 [Pseudomonadota bacterium]|nr:hypothetical protein [Pseudomonadota bacterium]
MIVMATGYSRPIGVYADSGDRLFFGQSRRWCHGTMKTALAPLSDLDEANWQREYVSVHDYPCAGSVYGYDEGVGRPAK